MLYVLVCGLVCVQERARFGSVFGSKLRGSKFGSNDKKRLRLSNIYIVVQLQACPVILNKKGGGGSVTHARGLEQRDVPAVAASSGQGDAVDGDDGVARLNSPGCFQSRRHLFFRHTGGTPRVKSSQFNTAVAQGNEPNRLSQVKQRKPMRFRHGGGDLGGHHKLVESVEEGGSRRWCASVRKPMRRRNSSKSSYCVVLLPSDERKREKDGSCFGSCKQAGHRRVTTSVEPSRQIADGGRQGKGADRHMAGQGRACITHRF